nr:ABC transporter G family member 35-like [Tanacetum cinerariifolium]
MDEISTGLDSFTTFQIVKCMQQVAHLTESTIFMSLLQPAPETFDLFDDIVLLSKGLIVYQGPREHIVTSKKDQEQYWADRNRQYRFIPVSEFSQRYKSFHVGEKLRSELSVPYDKSQSHQAALVTKKFLVPKGELSVSTDPTLGTIYSVTVPVRQVRAEYQEEDEAGTIVTDLTFFHILNL